MFQLNVIRLQKPAGWEMLWAPCPNIRTAAGHIAKVVMPMYRTKFLFNNEFDVVHKGYTNLGDWWFNYTVIKERNKYAWF